MRNRWGCLCWRTALAEHGGVYGELAASEVGRGFVMYAADHRGHGWTTPDMAQLEFFAAEDGWAKAVGDLGTSRALHGLDNGALLRHQELAATRGFRRVQSCS